jgi:hypothetical protein
MDIYQELIRVCPNRHHMNRYIRTINIFTQSPSSEGELHHILPRSLFPEYQKIPCNLIRLPYRVHFLVHWMLAKATNHFSMISAFNAMCNKNTNKIKRSVLYAYGKKLFVDGQTGINNVSYNMVSAWNKIENRRERITRDLFNNNKHTYGGITCKEALAWKSIHEGYVSRKQSNYQKNKASLAVKNTAPAVCIITNTRLGRVSLKDPRWNDGTIVFARRGYRHSQETKLKISQSKKSKS